MKYSRFLNYFFCVFCVFLLTACDKDDYQKAMKAQESGDYETAVELFTKLSKKKYEDSTTQLENTKIRQMIAHIDSGDWEKVNCETFWGRDDIVQDLSGTPDMTNRCFCQQAQFFKEHEKYEEALNALKRVHGKAPKEFDVDQMVFENQYALCKASEDQDELYQCLIDLAPYELQFSADTYSDFYKEKNVFYTDEALGQLLFWREEIGESGPFEQLNFTDYMERCLNNKGFWWCAQDQIFDMIYFADGDPVQAYQEALDWAELQEKTEPSDWLKNEPKRCIRNVLTSDYTGIAYPIDVPAACDAAIRPELKTWFQENADISIPAEGFWDSDTFYKTFDFDTSAPDFSGEGSIRKKFRSENPYPKSIAVIVSSDSAFNRPKESWRDNPDMTDDIVRWANDTAAAYKKTMPDWTFIDDPSQAAYILFFSMNWQQTGTFKGKVADEDIKVSVFNLHISGECWENREHGWRNKIITRDSDLGQENQGRFTPGITGIQPEQYLSILSENPLTIFGAEYDPETGRAYSVKRPDGYSYELVKWLEDIEAGETDK